MNDTQKALIAAYLPQVFLVAALDDLYPEAAVVKYVKYAIIVSYFLVALILKKKHREQKLMVLALMFAMLADFFLVFSTTLHLGVSLWLYGVLSFFLAYVCLIIAYHKRFSIGKRELYVAVPIAALAALVLITLLPYLHGTMLFGAVLFAAVLCYMTWSAVCTLFRRYFTKRAAVLIAISGVCMFICDLGVAYSLLDPYYFSGYPLWQKNIVWSAYLIGWGLLDVIISEDNLKTEGK